MKRTCVLLAALLCPVISMAGRGPGSADQFGRVAMDNAPSNLMAVLTRDEAGGGKALVSRIFNLPDGDLVATYGLDGDDWRLTSYTWDAARSTKLEGQPIGRMDNPVNPDPNPPTHEGHIGEKITHTFMFDSYEYTVDYSWGVQDGHLGWHIDKMESIYKPGSTPNEDHSGSG